MFLRRFITLALIVYDAAALFLIYNILAYARGVLSWPELLVTALLPPWLFMFVCFALIDGYKPKTDMLSADYTSQHLLSLLLTLLATLVLTFVLFPNGLPLGSSRSVIVLGTICLAPLTLGPRRWLRLEYQELEKGRSVVFIGDTESCRLFVEECTYHKTTQPIVLCPPTPEEVSEIAAKNRNVDVRPLKETVDELKSGRLGAEAIVLRETGHVISPETVSELMTLFIRGTPIHTLERFHQVYWKTIPLNHLNPVWLFQEGFKIASDPVFERIKHAVDLALAVVGFVLSSPLLLLCALAVKLGDGGPVLFSQTRIGKNNRPFKLYKFRTMREAKPGDSLYTKPGDKRITPFGRVLRATRLDEFPQLWNVIRGDMSLIGPRAEWDKLVAEYEKQIPCYHFRHIVRPGITGWAQINYPYGENIGDTLRKLEYDLYYIRYFSFRMDAAIVLRTIQVMLFGRGR